jgi:hypothetical protein
MTIDERARGSAWQGFLFAQPLDSEGIERFLSRNSAGSTSSTIL